MSVNDDALQPGSDSFWEVNCYKLTVRRHDEGHRLCGDLINLIQERADIEKQYAKSLRSWTAKWTTLIDKGPEYGTTQSAWKGVLSEADAVAELHVRVKDRLLSDVQNSIKQWRTDQFTKPMVGAIKETKELEDGFRKAQKPWSKRLLKVEKAKKEYHQACRLEKTAIHQESNARGDSGVSPDQLKKLQDKVEKYKNDVDGTRKKYESALNDLNSYNAKYMEDMSEVFNKSQEYEEKRLTFFKEMLFGLQKCLNLSETDEYSKIYEQFWQTVNNADHTKDLRWWAQNRGVDMAMNWPSFEEYSPEARAISKSKKMNVSGGEGGITLTSVQHKNDMPPSQPPSYDNYTMSNNTNQQSNSNSEPVDASPFVEDPLPVVYEELSPASLQEDNDVGSSVYDSSLNPFGDEDDTTTHKKNDNGQQNPFGDEEWEKYETQEEEGDVKGVPVRALYDYVGQEDDEISFKAGEYFIKLLDADEQGWCTGKKDTKVGLYPNNYAETVA